ncbi:hypothetical protein AOCH_003124 [Aspergillus ochraceoroseus]|nr:hypothetical protein AOCH_003124 [Aspergillus ochraceoroseus]
MNTQDLLSPVTQRSRPVVSFPASQSLWASTTLKTGTISTGISQLDDAVCTPSTEGDDDGDDDDGDDGDDDADCRGIHQGHVTEVYGPPGVGKTSLALNIASNALQTGAKVVWIDTGSPLPRLRLRSILLKSIQSSESTESPEELMKNLVYFRAQSLPHLLALLLHPPTGFPPDDSKLMVIDSASAPFPSYFSNPTELKARLAQSRTTDKSHIQWLMNRNSNVTSDLANQLTKLATAHNLAVLVINQTRTKIKGQPRATLCPVLAGGAWESSVYTRIVMYRDFPSDEEDTPKNVRFAEVTKRTGKMLALRLESNIIPFVIERDGLRGLDKYQSPRMVALNSKEDPNKNGQRKRKVDEISDSQDEGDSDAEYGWIDGDDAGLLEQD